MKNSYLRSKRQFKLLCITKYYYLKSKGVRAVSDITTTPPEVILSDDFLA
ncbi:MAG: hypothetical protein ACHQUB_01445 [Candidatus Saccharimonadia bacterium]